MFLLRYFGKIRWRQFFDDEKLASTIGDDEIDFFDDHLSKLSRYIFCPILQIYRNYSRYELWFFTPLTKFAFWRPFDEMCAVFSLSFDENMPFFSLLFDEIWCYLAFSFHGISRVFFIFWWNLPFFRNFWWNSLFSQVFSGICRFL